MFRLVGIDSRLPFDNLSRDPECLLLRRRARRTGNPRFGGLVQKNCRRKIGKIAKRIAMIAAWLGDKDLACEQLSILIHAPSNLSYSQLKLMPF
jgi:hypothetical protein